jgi:protein-disulfide isomerase
MSLKSKTTLPLFPILIISLLMGISAGCGAATPEPPTIAPPPTWPSQTPEGDPVKGSPDAPVTIIEYSEYQCPFCARFVQETLPLIEENYVATGKVRLIFRNFPVHEQAVVAAGAAICAQEQDEFWEMHDTLFAQQGEWSGNADFMTIWEGYAEDMGLDTEQFTSCLIPKEGKEPEWFDKLKRDVEAGQEAGVQGTPSFLINDQLVVGAQPFEVFQDVIEQELAK